MAHLKNDIMADAGADLVPSSSVVHQEEKLLKEKKILIKFKTMILCKIHFKKNVSLLAFLKHTCM